MEFTVVLEMMRNPWRFNWSPVSHALLHSPLMTFSLKRVDILIDIFNQYKHLSIKSTFFFISPSAYSMKMYQHVEPNREFSLRGKGYDIPRNSQKMWNTSQYESTIWFIQCAIWAISGCKMSLQMSVKEENNEQKRVWGGKAAELNPSLL